MDDRIRRHAGILVEHCTDVGPEDNVLIRAPTPAEDLVVALYERLGEVGARPQTNWMNSRAGRAYGRLMEPDDYETPEHLLAQMEETDVVILIAGSTNVAETSDVDPEKSAASSRANEPILEERLQKRWVITQHPTTGDAQRAEMSTPAWEDFVYEAVNKDWADQREHQAQLVEVLEGSDEVRVRAGETTDIRLSIDGMGVVSDYGKQNMPGGEVFTSPVVDSVEGEVTFDLPAMRNGREIREAHLVFEDGTVIEHSAEENEAVLTSLLETDAGARRLGELGIGMNRSIDQFSTNILFDEKMGDTVHLALGRAIEEAVPDDREFNESATHFDMLVDMSENATIEVDGEVVQRDGRFRFEDGFE